MMLGSWSVSCWAVNDRWVLPLEIYRLRSKTLINLIKPLVHSPCSNVTAAVGPNIGKLLFYNMCLF